MTIYFYSKAKKYGEFSNFSAYGFSLDGLDWPTVEHYFQAQKFSDPGYCEKIRQAKKPIIAKKLGRSRAFPLRDDWEKVKEKVMRRALLEKFTTHQKLKALLLSTGDEELVEQSKTDSYWGCGDDGLGKNRMGKILMEVRTILLLEGSF